MVALRTLKLNHSTAGDQAFEPPSGQPNRFASPPGPRRARVTLELRLKAIKLYEAGKTSRGVAEDCGCSKATVLKILKDAGVVIRPTGAHY